MTTIPMRQKKTHLLLPSLAIISLLALASLIYFLPPNLILSLPQNMTDLSFGLNKYIEISPFIIFFILVTLFLFSAGTYLFKKKAHGILITGLVVIYLIFRLSHLTHPFFLIILLALFFTLEMFVSSRGNLK